MFSTAVGTEAMNLTSGDQSVFSTKGAAKISQIKGIKNGPRIARPIFLRCPVV